MEQIKNWLSPKEVNLNYGLSVSTLARWRMDNLHLPYAKVGNYIKYKRSDIETFLTDNMIEVA
jgi:16S rRNA U516 pseudouridylate synthase RsuA-like enzyme